MKSYTDLEQSKKLVEILPIESADYHYIVQGENSYHYSYSLLNDAIEQYNGDIKYIPCWSLAALLGVMPKEIVYKGNIVFLEFRIWNTSLEYVNDGGYTLYATKSYDNLVDAAFEMICQLKENGKL